MKNKILSAFTVIFTISTLTFLSCFDSSDDSPRGNPSFITYEIQTYGDLSGGLFTDGKTTLTRYIREYAADNEDNVLGGFSSSINRWDIMGYANEDNHDGIKEITLNLPGSAVNGTGTYVFDSAVSYSTINEYFSIRVKSDYGLWLTGADEWYTNPETPLTIVLTEISDDWIKGTFTAELEAYNCIDNPDGSITLNRDDDISDVNSPVINGSFEVFRAEFD